MNEVLQNIMLFINEHTLLLIGICVFLILVLIGYLIDNSVKSKRIRNDIKNADQVPENIKDEIIKEAEDKKIIKQETTVEPQIDNALNIEESSKNNVPQENLNVDNSLNLETPMELHDTTTTTDTNNETINNSLIFNEKEKTTNEDTYKDPDLDIMGQMPKSEYSNDKGLSEILYSLKNVEPTNVDNVINLNEQVESNDTIFTTNTPNIVINNDVKKDDVQIQKEDSSDELDRIMRKLSSMNNNVEDDNYTNIF